MHQYYVNGQMQRRPKGSNLDAKSKSSSDSGINADIDPNFKSMKIKVFRNGDENDTGTDIAISKKNFRHWLKLLDYITVRLNVVQPIHTLCDMKGKEVNDFTELETEGRYVALDDRPFKELDYGGEKAKEFEKKVWDLKKWQQRTGMEYLDPTGLDSTESLEIYLQNRDLKSRSGVSPRQPSHSPRKSPSRNKSRKKPTRYGSVNNIHNGSEYGRENSAQDSLHEWERKDSDAHSVQQKDYYSDDHYDKYARSKSPAKDRSRHYGHQGHGRNDSDADKRRESRSEMGYYGQKDSGSDSDKRRYGRSDSDQDRNHRTNTGFGYNQVAKGSKAESYKQRQSKYRSDGKISKSEPSRKDHRSEYGRSKDADMDDRYKSRQSNYRSDSQNSGSDHDRKGYDREKSDFGDDGYVKDTDDRNRHRRTSEYSDDRPPTGRYYDKSRTKRSDSPNYDHANSRRTTYRRRTAGKLENGGKFKLE